MSPESRRRLFEFLSMPTRRRFLRNLEITTMPMFLELLAVMERQSPPRETYAQVFHAFIVRLYRSAGRDLFPTVLVDILDRLPETIKDITIQVVLDRLQTDIRAEDRDAWRIFRETDPFAERIITVFIRDRINQRISLLSPEQIRVLARDLLGRVQRRQSLEPLRPRIVFLDDLLVEVLLRHHDPDSFLSLIPRIRLTGLSSDQRTRLFAFLCENETRQRHLHQLQIDSSALFRELMDVMHGTIRNEEIYRRVFERRLTQVLLRQYRRGGSLQDVLVALMDMTRLVRRRIGEEILPDLLDMLAAEIRPGDTEEWLDFLSGKDSLFFSDALVLRLLEMLETVPLDLVSDLEHLLVRLDFDLFFTISPSSLRDLWQRLLRTGERLRTNAFLAVSLAGLCIPGDEPSQTDFFHEYRPVYQQIVLGRHEQASRLGVQDVRQRDLLRRLRQLLTQAGHQQVKNKNAMV
ncbi:hypothetical protein EBZ80_06620 [bacterium]|nr:hypothetical protein [bacterium]